MYELYADDRLSVWKSAFFVLATVVLFFMIWGGFSGSVHADPVHIPDDALREAIGDELGVDPDDLTEDDLEGLTELYANNKGISDVTGLEYAVNVKELYLDENNITDISPLENMTSLEVLALIGNQIDDLTLLSGLVNLKGVAITANDVNDLSILENLLQLRMIILHGSDITDIAFLSNLTDLETLMLFETEISDISPISNHSNLKTFAIEGSQVSDLSPLSGLTELTELWIVDSKIEDISPLSHLINLKSLDLPVNKIEDVSPLANLIGLERLDLSVNDIADISPLANLENVETLYFSHNHIGDISIIDGLTTIIRQSFDYQEIILPTYDLQVPDSGSDTDLAITNSIIGQDGSRVDNISVDGGSYTFSSGQVQWTGLTGSEDSVTYSFDSESSGFNGDVIQPINWYSLSDLNLPDLEFKEASCEDPAVDVHLPDIEGINFEVNGEMVPGGTVTIIAQPELGVTLHATEGWRLDDGYGSYEHTFAELGDCSVEVELPQPDIMEVSCEVPEVGIRVPETDGVAFEIHGDEEPGGTITIIAQPQGDTNLIATEGWRLDDGYGFYEHTFAELEDCSVEVDLPQPDITEASCEVPEVGINLPEIDGVAFEIHGDIEPGGTITIIAQPQDGVNLVATDGWRLDDGYGFYEHTFAELGDCSVEVELPQPDISEASCEVPTVDVDLPGIDGVVFEIQGNIEAGATITIIAQPQGDTTLVATDGWIIDDGYGFYEYTFAELDDCKEPEDPEKDPADPIIEDGDPEDPSDDPNKDEPKQDGQLPKTATNHFNLIMIGFLTILLGALTYTIIRRKTT